MSLGESIYRPEGKTRKPRENPGRRVAVQMPEDMLDLPTPPSSPRPLDPDNFHRLFGVDPSSFKGLGLPDRLVKVRQSTPKTLRTPPADPLVLTEPVSALAGSGGADGVPGPHKCATDGHPPSSAGQGPHGAGPLVDAHW
eukprot:566545-Prorocentrum_minimum.AAC.1